jgi:hypothetical protein
MAIAGGSSLAASGAKSCCHSPRSLQRLKRLNCVVRGPSLRRDRPAAQALAVTVLDAADHPPIIHLRLAAKARQQRLNRCPLRIAQPKTLAYGPKPSQ